MTEWAENGDYAFRDAVLQQHEFFLGEETDTYYLELYMPVIQSDQTP